MKTIHLQILFAIFFSCSFYCLSAQLPDYELKVLDLETKQTYAKSPENTFVAGDKVYFTTSNSTYDFLVYNGSDIIPIIEDQEDVIRILGAIDNGLFLKYGNSQQSLHFVPFSTDIPEQVFNLDDNNIKEITFINNKAVFLTYQNELYASDGTVAGTVFLNQLPSFLPDPALDHNFGDQLIIGSIGFPGGVWRTDGTAAGTYELLPNIYDFYDIIESNGLIYFSDNGDLYRTDGTVAGTFKISENYSINSLTRTASGITFRGFSPDFGNEIWVSDGTVAGTQMLLDLLPGSTTGVSSTTKVLQSQYLLFKGEEIYSDQLWISDGTVNGTFAIADFAGMPNFSTFYLDNSQELNSVGSFIYFTITDVNNERTLWSYNTNTTIATLLTVLDSYIENSYSSGDKMYFHLWDGGHQLWVTDGSVAGTLQLAVLESFDFLAAHNNLLYFRNSSGNNMTVGDEPMVSDGTINGTTLLKDINPGVSPSEIESDFFFVYNNILTFSAVDDEHNLSFYTTDGTENGTQFLVDIYPHSLGSNIENLKAVGGKLYFTIDDILHASNGTLEGTINLQFPTTSTTYSMYGEINGKMLFYSSANDYQLWVTDGTLAGTHALLGNSFTSYPQTHNAVKKDGYLWFFFDDGISGKELYKSDGTIAGTGPAFQSINGSGSLWDIQDTKQLVVNGDFMYFYNLSSANETELWRTDGTSAGTSKIKTLFPGSIAPYHDILIAHNGKVFFNAKNGASSNFSLWVTDGTEAGTYSIKNTAILSHQSASIGQKLLFFSDNSTLWITDGTTEGTENLLDLIASYTEIKSYNEKAIFNRDEQTTTGKEPWITDGTESGTFLLKDITPGTFGSGAYDFTAVENVIAFLVESRLWITDGTTEGTTLAVDESYGELDDVTDLNMYRGKIFFIAENNIYGKELFYLDFNATTNMEGTVYKDMNENGIQDIDESGIPNVPVEADGSLDITSYTNESGQFQFYTPEDNYIIAPYLTDCYAISSDSLTYTVTTGSNVITGLDFGIHQISDEAQLWSNIVSGPTRCGFIVPFWINVINTGCDISSGEVVIELDNLVEFVSAEQTPSSISGNTITWNFTDVDLGASHQIKLYLKMPDEFSAGATITIASDVLLLENNNELTLEREFDFSSVISCAIDPNDKQVVPDRSGLSEENYTLFEEELIYTIRFQNTGTDTAFTVAIRDTLSPFLDLETFQPMMASHSYRTTISPTGAIEFLFENILLPDSNVNEIASHGFVTFRINTVENIEEFTEIKNTAYIYFDYNGPVITNAIASTLVSVFDGDGDGFLAWDDCDDTNPDINPNAVEIPDNGIDENCDGIGSAANHLFTEGAILIYPNPSTDFIEIQLKINSSFLLRVFDCKGVFLEEKVIERDELMDLRMYSAGLYFLEVTEITSGKKSVMKFVKI